MAKRNYGFEKHQKEQRKQQKKEEKERRKLDRVKQTPDAKPDNSASPNGPPVL